MKNALYLTTAAAALMLGTVPAFAQSMDYGELEDTFGEPVTTSATGKPQRASDVPVAMTIISGDEIRRTGAVNLAEALRGRAGIDVNRWSAQSYDVAIRGGNQPLNPRVLVMVNGRQVYIDQFGYTSWSNLGIELSEIRQVEIVKGPMSPLFGYNAASGVINIITYHPIYDRVNEVSAQVGVDGERAVSAMGTLPLGSKAGVRVSGGYARQNEYSLEYTAFTNIPTPHRENVAVDLSAELAANVTGRINYAYSNSFQNSTELLYSSPDTKTTTHGVLGVVTADTKIGTLEARGYYNRSDSRLDFNLSPIAPNAYMFNRVAVVQLQDLIKPTSNDTIRVTVEYRNNNMYTTPSLAGEVYYNNYAAGLTWEHSFSSALVATVAARVDRMDVGQKGDIASILALQHSDFNVDTTEVSWTAALVAKPTASTTVRLQAARGIQPPSLATMGGALYVEFMPGTFAVMRGQPSISPAITHGYEVGLTQQIAPINGALVVNGFYLSTKDVQNLMSYAPEFNPAYGMVFPQQFLNGGEFTSYGAEVALKGNIANALHWNVDYTYNRIKEDFLPYLVQAAHPFAETTPRHKVGVGMGYNKGPFELDVRTLYRSKINRLVYTLTDDGVIPRKAAFGVDARVAVKPTDHFELFAVGENLSNSDYVDNGMGKQETRGRIGARLKF